jgi:hypothetical protein
MSTTVADIADLGVEERVKQFVAPYINNFKRYLSQYLKPNFGLSTAIIPFDNGTLVKFEFIEGVPTSSRKNASNISEAFSKGNLELVNESGKKIINFNASGTNIIANKNEIFIIKDNSEAEWTDQKAERDVHKIIFG